MVISHSEGKDKDYLQQFKAQGAIWNPSKYRPILNNYCTAGDCSTTTKGAHHSRQNSDNKFNPPRYILLAHIKIISDKY